MIFVSGIAPLADGQETVESNSYLKLSAFVLSTLLLLGCDDESGLNTASSRLDEDCNYVAIEDLQANPVPYDGQIICTEGMIRVAYEGMAIHPEGMDYEDHFRVSIHPGITLAEAVDRPLYTGDRISLKGMFSINRPCLEGPTLRPPEEAFFCFPIALPAEFSDVQAQVVNQVLPSDRCQHVTIESLYTDPALYHDRLICTNGFIDQDEEQSALAPENIPGGYPDTIRLDLFTNYNLEEGEIADGNEVQAVGWFSVDLGCLETFGSDLDKCHPIEVPMEMDLYELKNIN